MCRPVARMNASARNVRSAARADTMRPALFSNDVIWAVTLPREIACCRRQPCGEGGLARSSKLSCGRLVTSLALRQEAEIKRLSLLAEVMRRQTEKRARTAKSIFKRVDRLKAQQVSAPRRERKVRISFPDPPRSGRVALGVEGLAKGYGGPLVFRDVSFEVERGQRLLVMGLNGAGKTSMLRILAGE